MRTVSFLSLAADEGRCRALCGSRKRMSNPSDRRPKARVGGSACLRVLMMPTATMTTEEAHLRCAARLR